MAPARTREMKSSRIRFNTFQQYSQKSKSDYIVGLCGLNC